MKEALVLPRTEIFFFRKLEQMRILGNLKTVVQKGSHISKSKYKLLTKAKARSRIINLNTICGSRFRSIIDFQICRLVVHKSWSLLIAFLQPPSSSKLELPSGWVWTWTIIALSLRSLKRAWDYGLNNKELFWKVWMTFPRSDQVFNWGFISPTSRAFCHLTQ